MLQTRPLYRQNVCSRKVPLWSTPCRSLCLDWWFRLDEFWTRWQRSLILCDIGKNSTSLSFRDSPISSSFIAEITVLRHALGWCLQHHSTCPFIFQAIFTNFHSSLTLLNSTSNLLAPNAVWTIWSSAAAYLIWPNCPSIGSLATATYVPMRSQTY